MITTIQELLNTFTNFRSVSSITVLINGTPRFKFTSMIVEHNRSMKMRAVIIYKHIVVPGHLRRLMFAELVRNISQRGF